MADFISKIRIPKATEHFSNFNLSCSHVTTMDWFKLKPVYYRWLNPGQSINIDMAHTIRLAPLKKPFYGPTKIVNRAFFVPARTIMEGFAEFIADTPYVSASGFNGIISHVPTITASELLAFVTVNKYVYTTTSNEYDIRVGNASTGISYNYTAKGRYVVDILRCLGYQIDGNATEEGKNYTLSALPLLAFMKVYSDYFTNTNFAPFVNIEKFFKTPDKVITSQDLFPVFDDLLFAPYENDYFTASWSTPSSPYTAASSSVTLTDQTFKPGQSISSSVDYDVTTSTPTPRIIQGDTQGVVPGAITSYILTALQGLSNYMKRHQLSGYRAIDRIRTRFGVTLPDTKLNRSEYLGKSVSQIQITDVTSTADTDQAVLGQYTGFGISRDSSGHWTYKTDEFGFFMVLSIIVPERAQYANGIDRHLLDINKLDLYTPEFDGLGCQAIANLEVKSDNLLRGSNVNPKGVWAYIPRYGHLKVSRDWLTGDFRLNSHKANMDCFHMFRDFDTLPGHSLSFCTGNPQDYDRLFNDTEENDHFFANFTFKVSSKAPMSPLFENYHFDEAGQLQDIKVGGTKLS